MEIFRLSPQFIKFSISELETAKTIDNNKQGCVCKILQALGAIDGTNIFKQTPENKRKWLLLSETKLLSQYPSMHDSWVLRYYLLFWKTRQNEIFQIPEKYSLHKVLRLHWTTLKKSQREAFIFSCNCRSFCICKTHWRCFLKRLDNKVKNVLDVIFTCLALHNFCQINGELKLIKTLYLRISFKRRWKSWEEEC